MVDFEAAADGGGDGLEVAGVGADDQVPAAQGSLDDAGVDDVGGGGAAGERADGAGLGIVEGLDVASGKQPGQEGLAAAAAPGLGQDVPRGKPGLARLLMPASRTPGSHH